VRVTLVLYIIFSDCSGDIKVEDFVLDSFPGLGGTGAFCSTESVEVVF
jgi:hypothetical protein